MLMEMFCFEDDDSTKEVFDIFHFADGIIVYTYCLGFFYVEQFIVCYTKDK